MSIFSIHHITRYEYSRPVKENLNQIKIHPYVCLQQEILNHELIITGNPDVHLFSDYWGNRTGIFTLLQAHKELVIESKLKIRTLSEITEPLSTVRLEDEVIPSNNILLTELSQPELIKQQAAIHSIVTSIQAGGKPVVDIIRECNEYIFKNFQYTKGITDFETTVDQILEHRGGVCQDFAHVLLQLLRTIGIPARYVSGYICPNKNGMRGEGATHAWVEAWVPDLGWMGIDPTNNVWVANNHVKLAIGRNFNDCSPVRGTFKGLARQTLSVYVSVGYEDGVVYEDINKVVMDVKVGNEVVEEEPDILPNQQQQQQ
jgi:transglutaminase-like putative cysteine protease